MCLLFSNVAFLYPGALIVIVNLYSTSRFVFILFLVEVLWAWDGNASITSYSSASLSCFSIHIFVFIGLVRVQFRRRCLLVHRLLAHIQQLNARSCETLSNGTDPQWRYSKSKAREGHRIHDGRNYHFLYYPLQSLPLLLSLFTKTWNSSPIAPTVSLSTPCT
ncbi:hypothetical protein BT96DRAFT_450399 [Gymnopus androsaceus JB14]|uniref:Uncharacterized protein n=1 Tax=Gymnopus androsaceus JB14 TaxID=1447944 RepID=A0A6A4GRD1_9AGAR|nr:hypothetical protein BT96DRAFT_450399 [Gymnopus androsaceus JB14]